MRLTRRDLLAGLGAGALAGGLGGPLIRSAGAATGTLTPYSLSGGPYKVLEVFLAGALSHQETIWMTDDEGPTWSGHRDATAWSGLPCDAGDVVQIGVDALGNDVFLGGMCAPLDGTWPAATRVVALGHEQPAHVAAIPYALGGHTLGRPARAGLGAAIGRLTQESEISTPTSFVLHGGSRAVARHALATGHHGSACRPIELALGNDGARVVAQLVARGGDTYREGLLDLFGARYGQRLINVFGQPVRAVTFDDHDAARRQLGQAGSWAGDLQSLTSTAPMQYDSTETWTNAAGGSPDGYITRAITLAAGLLAGASGPAARHVCVIDDGAGVAQNYDGHAAQHTSMTEAFERQAGQLWWVLSALRSTYGSPPTDTLIVIHTEFGRRQILATGTEHHTTGYAAMLIGGPVVGGVGGSMTNLVTDPSLGALQPSPAELHAAVLYAAGLDPTHADCFGGYGSGALAFADEAALLTYMLGV